MKMKKLLPVLFALGLGCSLSGIQAYADDMEIFSIEVISLDLDEAVADFDCELLLPEDTEGLHPDVAKILDVPGYVYDEKQGCYCEYYPDFYEMTVYMVMSDSFSEEEQAAAAAVKYPNPWVFTGDNVEGVVKAYCEFVYGKDCKFKYDEDMEFFTGEYLGDEFSGDVMVDGRKISLTLYDTTGDIEEVSYETLKDLADFYDKLTLKEDHSNLKDIIVSLIGEMNMLDREPQIWTVDTLDDETGLVKGSEGDEIAIEYTIDKLTTGEEYVSVTQDDGKSLDSNALRCRDAIGTFIPNED